MSARCSRMGPRAGGRGVGVAKRRGVRQSFSPLALSDGQTPEKMWRRVAVRHPVPKAAEDWRSPNRKRLLTQDGLLSVGEFFVAAVVAAVADEFLGGGEIVMRGFPRVRFLAEKEAGAVEVDVGQVQPHGA